MNGFDSDLESEPAMALLLPTEALSLPQGFPGHGSGGAHAGGWDEGGASRAAGLQTFPATGGNGVQTPGVPLAVAVSKEATLAQRQGFSVGSLNLMIRYEDGSELTELPGVHRLPNAPAWFLGMANLHSRLVPVFDLAGRLGAERPERAKPRLLVLAHGADAAGVVIDGLPQRLKFDAAETAADEGCVPPALRPFVKSVHLIDSQLWLDLEVDGLLDALEEALAA